MVQNFTLKNTCFEKVHCELVQCYVWTLDVLKHKSSQFFKHATLHHSSILQKARTKEKEAMIKGK